MLIFKSKFLVKNITLTRILNTINHVEMFKIKEFSNIIVRYLFLFSSPIAY